MFVPMDLRWWYFEYQGVAQEVLERIALYDTVATLCSYQNAQNCMHITELIILYAIFKKSPKMLEELRIGYRLFKHVCSANVWHNLTKGDRKGKKKT